MTKLEIAQQTYLSAAVLVRVAGEELARARAELLAAKAAEDTERIAIASFRSAYAVKLWEMRLREEHEALLRFNAELSDEAGRCQQEADRLWSGSHRCTKPVAIPEERPMWWCHPD